MKRFNPYNMRLFVIRACIIIAAIVVLALVVYGIIFLSLVGGADYTTYPDEVAEVWICEEPYFEIRFGKTDTEAYVEIDGQLKPVIFAMGRPEVVVLERDPMEIDPMYWEENRLLRCKWKLVDNTLVLTVREDNLFDGKYTELVFVAQQ